MRSVVEDESSDQSPQVRTNDLQFSRLAVFSTMLSLVGFVLQLIDLRGFYWSASVAQLGAIVLMAVLIATVRRGFSDTLRSENLTPSHELDWFAVAVCNSQFTLDQNPSKPKDWIILMRLLEDELKEDLNPNESDVEETKEKSLHTNHDSSTAYGVMMIRRGLAMLAD